MAWQHSDLAHRWRRCALLVLVWLVGVLVEGCTAATTGPVVVSSVGPFAVILRSTTLTLAANQTGQSTAICHAGEHLVSGGYASSFQNYFAAAQEPNIHPTDVKELKLNSYPSDASGTPPSSMGQAVSGWTVATTEASPFATTISVYANCVTDASVATAIWSTSQFTECPPVPFFSRARSESGDQARAPSGPLSGCGLGYEVACPANSGFPVITGGGWKVNAGNLVLGSYPSQDQGVAKKTWRVLATGVGTAYAVCAKGMVAKPLAELLFSPTPSAIPPCLPGTCAYQSDVTQSVKCPANQSMVGGGQYVHDTTVNTSAISPAISPVQPGKWFVRHAIKYANDIAKNYYPTSIAIYGLCVSAPLSITLKNIPWVIRLRNHKTILASPGEVAASLGGGGQVALKRYTANVTQQPSGSIPAMQTRDPTTGRVAYIVPEHCGDPAPANAATTQTIQSKLKGQVPAIEVPVFGPTVTLNGRSLTCSPVAGTRQARPFTYIQYIDGAGVEVSYNPADVRSYQLQRVEAALKGLGPDFLLSEVVVCPDGLRVSQANQEQAMISCPSHGIAQYGWSSSKLDALAASVTGKSTDEAKVVLRQAPGTDAESLSIEEGTGRGLPSDPAQIEIVVIGI